MPSDGILEGRLVVAKGVPQTSRSTWVGCTEESDEHLVVNGIGRVVRVRTVRRSVENENSGPTFSSLLQLRRISSLMVATWRRDGLRRKYAKRVSQHTETSTWYDVKHIDASIV